MMLASTFVIAVMWFSAVCGCGMQKKSIKHEKIEIRVQRPDLIPALQQGAGAGMCTGKQLEMGKKLHKAHQGGSIMMIGGLGMEFRDWTIKGEFDFAKIVPDTK